MQVGDLGRPVTAMKQDWLPGDAWLGFTPKSNTNDGRAKAESAINKSVENGLILEYITKSFGSPNPEFKGDQRHQDEVKRHKEFAGKLVAIHQVQVQSQPLHKLIPLEEFEQLQDRWAQGGKRWRWSVAFPITNTYKIIDPPLATDIFGQERCRSLIGQESYLRRLNDEDRAAIAHLKIEEGEAINHTFELERLNTIAKANHEEQSVPLDFTEELIHMDQDFNQSVQEGQLKERLVKFRYRAAEVAQKFKKDRAKSGTLFCEKCNFDPATATPSIPRDRLISTLDAHHKEPLSFGVRDTTASDFALLCPTCHRLEHIHLDIDKS